MSQSGPVGPSIWVVSDGRAGIEKQAVALARALCEFDRWSRLSHIRSNAHRSGPIRIAPKPPQVWLPPTMWPAPFLALSKADQEVLSPPWPDIWIGSGRRAAPYSMKVRELSGGQTFVIQTQNPKVPLNHFDLVVPPEHDQLSGPNVVSTVGAPAYFPTEDIEDAALKFPDLQAEPGRKIAVIIGGKSKTHTLTEARLTEIESELQRLAGKGARLWISVSRRTPEFARIRLRQLAETVGGRFFESESIDGPNPYLAYLSLSDAILVTEDSANMISEAAWFGKPVYMIRMQGKSAKFDRMHDSFLKNGVARWFEGQIDDWSPEPLREVERVADIIVEKVLERHPRRTNAA